MTIRTCPQCDAPADDREGECSSCSAASIVLTKGTRLQDRYVIGHPVAVGRSSVVYYAADHRERRAVAIKELISPAAQRQGMELVASPMEREPFGARRARFLSAARMVREAVADGLVPVFDVFESNGTAYVVMPYLQGAPLASWLSHQPMPLPSLRLLAQRLAGAVQGIHRAGWLHNALSPEHVFVTRDRQIMVINPTSAMPIQPTDDGYSPLEEPHPYAAPEQYSKLAGRGAFTDIYAIGAIVHHAATCAPPPLGPDRLLGAPLPTLPSSLPSGFQEGIIRAMAPMAAERPASWAAFLALLEAPHSVPDQPSVAVAAEAHPPIEASPATAGLRVSVSSAPTRRLVESAPPAQSPQVSPDRASALQDSPATKKCPQCAEIILAEATKCRYCGSRVVSRVQPLELNSSTQGAQRLLLTFVGGMAGIIVLRLVIGALTYRTVNGLVEQSIAFGVVGLFMSSLLLKENRWRTIALFEGWVLVCVGLGLATTSWPFMITGLFQFGLLGALLAYWWRSSNLGHASYGLAVGLAVFLGLVPTYIEHQALDEFVRAAASWSYRRDEAGATLDFTRLLSGVSHLLVVAALTTLFFLLTRHPKGEAPLDSGLQRRLQAVRRPAALVTIAIGVLPADIAMVGFLVKELSDFPYVHPIGFIVVGLLLVINTWAAWVINARLFHFIQPAWRARLSWGIPVAALPTVFLALTMAPNLGNVRNFEALGAALGLYTAAGVLMIHGARIVWTLAQRKKWLGT